MAVGKAFRLFRRRQVSLQPVPAEQETTAGVLQRANAIQMHLRARAAVFQPSLFWEDIASQNMAMIAEAGITNFKRNLSQNYFNWAVQDASDPQMRSLLAAWSAEPSRLPLEAELQGASRVNSINSTTYLESKAEQRAYTLFVGLLWWFVTRDDFDGLGQRLAEPLVGNPIRIELGGRLISQDLGNALREFRMIQPHLQNAGPTPVVAEIGAGYGRFGYVALSGCQCRYWIFDIAPALAVAEWYLSEVFRQKSIFRWRPFSAWTDVAAEVEASDIAFFSIDQLPLVPSGAVAAFVSISALHEMTPIQIRSYLELQSRTTTAAIFTKNWTEWKNVNDDFLFRSDEIACPDGWHTVVDAVDPIIPTFTQKLFVKG